MLLFCLQEEINCQEANLNHLYLTMKQRQPFPAGPHQPQKWLFLKGNAQGYLRPTSQRYKQTFIVATMEGAPL